MSIGGWIEELLREVQARFGSEPSRPPSPAGALPPRLEELFSYGWRESHPLEALALELNYLVDWLDDPEHRGAAAARIATLARGIPVGGLARFDETYRRALRDWGRGHEPRWLSRADWNDHDALRRIARAVEALEVPAYAAPWVFGVLAMDPGGYVREGAVRRLASMRGGDELPFLLLRANDWIPAVRAVAAGAVEERAALREYTPELVYCFPLLTRLGESRRGEVDAVVSAVRATLGEPAARSSLLGGLHSSDRRVRRPAYTLLTAGEEGAELRQLVVVGLHSDDQVLRSLAVHAAARMDPDSMRAVLPELMRAGHPPARTEGVRIAATLGPEGEGWILAAACDRNALVRATARAALKARGVTDFAAFYRRELETEGDATEGALLGLGEVGRAEEAEFVEPFLDAGSPRVRASAVEALDHLRREAAVPAILPLLSDGAPRVSRAARKALARRPVPPSAPAALFAGAHPPHVRANALMLLARGSKWDAIPTIVRGAADEDPRVADAGRRALGRWRLRFHQSFQAPVPEQLSRLAAELDAAGERIDLETASWMRDVIRSYGG